MATARLISKSISTSKRWNRLSSWFTKTLYMLLIVHTDDYGIIDGDAEEIKWKVLPAASETPKQIESALEEMRQLGLIHRYQWKGHNLTEIIQFESHQQGLHKRTNRKFPSFQEITEEQGGEGNSFPEIPGNSGSKPEVPASRARADKDLEEDKEYISSDFSDEDMPPLNGHKKSTKGNKDRYAQEKAEVIAYLNELRGVGTGFRPNSKAAEHISARMEEGWTVEDCKAVIRLKVKRWKGTSQSEYLRPDTLFNSEKFEGYLVEAREFESREEKVDPLTAFAREKTRQRKEGAENV